MAHQVPKTPKVSIIMPIYNVERYVERAVISMQRQTLENFEFLIVDEGSKDRSGAICDRMAERDVRLKVFHVENGGAAAARNYALDRAQGEFVYFMDGDDWCEPTMLADMVNMAELNNLELVIAGFYIDTYYDADQHTSELKSVPSVIYPSQQSFRASAWQLFDQNLLYTPWNKLFVRARIEELGLRFRPTFMDDFPFCLDYIRDVERVGVTEHAYYHFIRARAESETQKWRPNLYEKREEEHGWMLELYSHWDLSGDPASTEMVQRRYIERLVGCIENVCNPACTMSSADKRAEISRMISTDHARTAVAIAQPRSRMMKMMLAPIKQQNSALAYREGCFISWVRRHDTKLFATLKARR